MPWNRPRSKPPKLRLPIVLTRGEAEALAEALQIAIDQSIPGCERLSFLYTLLRKNERILRKFQEGDDAVPEDFDDL